MTPRPEKVLFLLPSLDGGGAQRVFSILLRYLDRSRFEPHLALFRAEGPYLKGVPADVVIHELKASRARYALPFLVRLVRQTKPRAILTTLGHMNMALMMASPFLPRQTRLLIRETATLTALPDFVSHPWLWGSLCRLLYRRADRIICLSDAMVDDLALHFGLPRAKLVRIYNPVDVDEVRRLAQCGGNPYSGSGPHLVAAGRLSREKGFDLLLAAMPCVLARFPDATLTILGEGPLAGALATQAEHLGIAQAVSLPGFLENPWPYFRNASVFVLPSRYEGLPNVVLEALTVGAPVVAADCPGAIRELKALHPDIVIVPPDAPRALAEAILSACAGPARGGGSRQDSSLALGKFSVSQIVSEYSNLLLS